LVRHASERGINYFDSAESYRWGNAEEAIGEALQGKRHKILLATKTKAGASDTRADMMKALEGSLKRLRTDHVDVYFNHSVNDVARIQNLEWAEFTELAKRQGKIRFRGMSGHGSALVNCLDYAIDHDLVDVILVAYNVSHDPTMTDKMRHLFHWSAIQPHLPEALAKAKKKDIGVIAMKTLMGARLNDMRRYERPNGTFSQAAFRWVLSSPNIDALIVSMTSTEQIDEYVAASGDPKLARHDLELLERYAALRAGNYCQPGCNACAESCPQQVNISEVLRTRMYDVDYGDRALAKAEYAALETGARPTDHGRTREGVVQPAASGNARNRPPVPTVQAVVDRPDAEEAPMSRFRCTLRLLRSAMTRPVPGVDECGPIRVRDYPRARRSEWP